MIDIPERWTPIAYEKSGDWVLYPGFPLTLKEVRKLHEEGHLLMAQRRALPTQERPIMHMQIVIKRAAQKASRR